ncbi:MAG: AI-2E family transporter [Thermoanaerobaculales bacterium]|jgi:predicted PurR-regulated permease PerM|nr:AI-2E family transporter [Thermoanaerobaculales bacterium]
MDLVRIETTERPARASWVGLVIAVCLSLAVVIQVLAPFGVVILLAVVAAGLIYPWYVRIVRFLRGRRHAAAVFVCVMLLVVVFVPLYIVGSDVSREALGFYELSTIELAERWTPERVQQRQEQIDRVNALIRPTGVVLTAEKVSDWMATAGVRIGGFFYKQGVSVAKGLLRFVFGFIFWVLILYFLLVDGDHVRRWFRDTVPIPRDEQRQLRSRFMEMASSLVVGNGVAGIIQGIAGGVVFAAVGLPGPVLWGAVMGILAFIPVIGISFVFIPTAIVLFIAGETGRALAVLVPLATIATLVEYGLKPMMVGRRGQLHPLLVLLSLIGGLAAYGAVGILVGPLMMTAFLTLISIYQDHYRPWLGVPRTASRLEVDDEE